MKSTSIIQFIWKDLLSSIKQVFKHKVYWFIMLATSVIFLLIILWLPSHEFIGYAIRSDYFNFFQKLKILFVSLGSFQTNFTVTSRIIMVLLALLAGINISMLVFHIKRRAKMQKSAGVSFAGILVGLLGVGCSACGSVMLSTIFGIGASNAIIGFLPLRGIEFQIVSIIIMLSSIVYVAKKINSNIVCTIPIKKS